MADAKYGRPLEGMRIIDLTVVWAGPYGTMLLGDLGAEVVRVDNPWLFPTATRGTMPRPPAAMVPEMGPLASYPDDDPGPRRRRDLRCVNGGPSDGRCARRPRREPTQPDVSPAPMTARGRHQQGP